MSVNVTQSGIRGCTLCVGQLYVVMGSCDAVILRTMHGLYWTYLHLKSSPRLALLFGTVSLILIGTRLA